MTAEIVLSDFHSRPIVNSITRIVIYLNLNFLLHLFSATDVQFSVELFFPLLDCRLFAFTLVSLCVFGNGNPTGRDIRLKLGNQINHAF